MYGLLLESADGRVTVVILPYPLDHSKVALSISIDGLMLPTVYIPVAEIEMVLEGRSG